MSSDNSTEAAAGQTGERITSSELAPPSQETRRRSIQPGIIRQNAVQSMKMIIIIYIAKSTMHNTSMHGFYRS